MLSEFVNLNDRHDYVEYLRFSDDAQNERSIDQQHDEIERVLAKLGYRWNRLRSYADRGESGKRQNREQFLRMVRDIEAGIIKPRFILTDTSERCGRNDQIGPLLQTLKRKYGVMRLVAALNFSPPTGVAGVVTEAFENVRAQTENMTKSHQVARGMRDLVVQGFWPGGPVPFGYQLKKEVVRVGGRDKFRSRLALDPNSIWIRQRVIRQAAEGMSPLFITRGLNEDTDIPDVHKPFDESHVRRMVTDTIAIGVFRYPKVERDIIADINVSRRRLVEDVKSYENFVEPCVDRELFERAQSVCQNRRQPSTSSNPYRNCVRGLKVTSPLAGLVFCSQCGRRMTPISSGRKSKAGTSYRYYHCQRARSGACSNKRHVDRTQLEASVIQLLRNQLLPVNGNAVPEWFAPFVEQVRELLKQYESEDGSPVESLRHQVEDLNAKISGWSASLGDPKLAEAVRRQLEGELEQALADRDELITRIRVAESDAKVAEQLLDPGEVLNELKVLEQTLSTDNPALTNVELLKHIIRIVCYPDGAVVLEGTNVGLFPGLSELSVVQSTGVPAAAAGAPLPFTASSRSSHVGPRRLTPRDTGQSILDDKDDDLGGRRHDALKVDRYDHLAPEFCWEARILIEERKPQSQTDSERIIVYKKAHPKMPLYKVADHFGRTPWFIRQAMKHAQHGVEPSDPIAG